MEYNSDMEIEAMISENLSSNNCILKKINQNRVLHPAFVAVLTILLVMFGFGWFVIPYVIRHAILSKAVISPDVNPELYSAWIHPPVPIHLKVYLFNVTNSEEVQRGFRPKLLEVGPYVFRENRTKINIHHDEDTDTVTYKEHFTYHFEQHLSGDLKLQDEITIINTPYVAAAIKINNELPWPVDSLANMILIRYKESLFVRRTVEEILFQGWTVPFLQEIETDIGLTLVLNNTFGLLIGQNDSAQGPYTVARGALDKSQFGTILKYKNESELSYWPKSSQCNNIHGSDGAVFSPFVEKRTVLKLFNSDLCRSLYLSYNQSIDFEGIQGYRFTVPPSVLADPRENNENHCFCPNIEEEPDKCLKKGTLDLGPCREGAPVAMSTPYFLDADPQYLEESGLMPVRSEHETFLDIEPMTGIIMQASKRIQINLILKRVKGIASISKVPEMLFPLIWMDESTSLDVENRLKLQSILYNVRLLDFISKIIPIATLLIVLSIVVKRKFNRT